MTETEFYTIQDKIKWNKYINQCDVYDFYHTFDYHLISSKKNEKPVLLVYKEDQVLICLPLIIRKIDNTNYYDATSVYGYAGPINKGINANFNNAQFIDKILNYFRNNKIISVFSRLNPFIPHQNLILENFGPIINKGNVVNIQIQKSISEQKKYFQNRLKTHINKAHKNCIIIKALTNIHLQEFVKIYTENMNRVNAKDYYYFESDYFYKINKSEDFNSEIFLAIDRKSGKTIAGCNFITTNDIVQYHLSGVKNNFRHLMPTKLLINEMRIIATQRGNRFFNLGGGIGGNDNESLFKFKASYSKDFKNFNVLNVVVDKKVYENLVTKKDINKNLNFFPLYRALEDINVTS